MNISRNFVILYLVVILSSLVFSQSLFASNDDIYTLQYTTDTEAYSIVDTGLTLCYDDSIEISYPLENDPFYGQDAQFIGNHPSYKNNGDGTITDLNTGLMWQQDPGDKLTFSEAVLGADTFSLAGYDDWRLPTIKELYSLICFSGTDPSGINNPDDLIPFIDTNYFVFEYGDEAEGERIIDSQYWSSTEYISTTMGDDATVFGVNFADGRIKGYPRDMGPDGTPKTEFVLYVRGNENYGLNEFVDNGDGTISDIATGLMWSKNDNNMGMDWEDALAWVQQKNAVNYLGYDDWRLPNAKELQSIVDYSRAPSVTDSAAIDPLFDVSPITDEGGNLNYPFYWTSTTHRHLLGGSSAVYIAFGDALGWMQDPISGDYTLMDVHGAGAQRSDPKSGDPDSYPYGHGPQGDVIRINNYVRCVRDGLAESAESADDYPSNPIDTDKTSFDIVLIGVFCLTFVTIVRKRKGAFSGFTLHFNLQRYGAWVEQLKKRTATTDENDQERRNCQTRDNL